MVFVDYLVYDNYTMCTVPYISLSNPSSNYQFVYQLSPAYEVSLTAVIVLSNIIVDFNSITNFSSLISIEANIDINVLGFELQVYPLHCQSPAIVPTVIAKLNLAYKILTDYESINSTNLQALNITFAPSSNYTQTQLSIK